MKKGWFNQVLHHIDIDPAGAEHLSIPGSGSFHEK